VLNACGRGSRVIESLDGGVDGEPQAEAVARNYLTAGRFMQLAGGNGGEAIPEQGGADAHSDPRPRSAARQSRARGLRCRIRLSDGRIFTGELRPERHRSLQIGMLHQETDGLVELAAYTGGHSLRQVAAKLHPRTPYKTVASCTEALYGHFKRRGWKLRPQRDVTVARNYKHGRKPHKQTREQQNAYRRWLAEQRGWRAVQGPGRPLCKGVKLTPPGKAGRAGAGRRPTRSTATRTTRVGRWKCCPARAPLRNGRARRSCEREHSLPPIGRSRP
jgi:hypothetical protein